MEIRFYTPEMYFAGIDILFLFDLPLAILTFIRRNPASYRQQNEVFHF